MKIYRNFFGRKLKRALAKSELTQFQLSEKLDVEPSTVSRWVTGQDFPHDDRIPEICKILGVKQEYFTEGDPGPTVESLIDAMKKIQEDNQQLKAKNYPSLLMSEEYIIIWGELTPEQRKDILDSKLLQTWAASNKSNRELALSILKENEPEGKIKRGTVA